MCLCPNHGPCTDPAVEVGRPCLWSRPQHTLLSSLLGLALNHAGSCLCLGHQVTLLRPHLHHCHEPVWVLHVFKATTNIPEPVSDSHASSWTYSSHRQAILSLLVAPCLGTMECTTLFIPPGNTSDLISHSLHSRRLGHAFEQEPDKHSSALGD